MVGKLFTPNIKQLRSQSTWRFRATLCIYCNFLVDLERFFCFSPLIESGCSCEVKNKVSQKDRVSARLFLSLRSFGQACSVELRNACLQDGIPRQEPFHFVPPDAETLEVIKAHWIWTCPSDVRSLLRTTVPLRSIKHAWRKPSRRSPTRSSSPSVYSAGKSYLVGA